MSTPPSKLVPLLHPAMSARQQASVATIEREFLAAGFPLALAAAAVVNAYAESSLVPTAANGPMVGLFQLDREVGAGRGMSSAELVDPAANTRAIIREVQGPRGKTLREAIAAGERHPHRLAYLFCRDIERPANAEKKALHREGLTWTVFPGLATPASGGGEIIGGVFRPFLAARPPGVQAALREHDPIVKAAREAHHAAHLNLESAEASYRAARKRERAGETTTADTETAAQVVEEAREAKRRAGLDLDAARSDRRAAVLAARAGTSEDDELGGDIANTMRVVKGTTQLAMATMIEDRLAAAGLPAPIIVAAIVNAYAESGLNPMAYASEENGTNSVGLFQLNSNGVGRGMTVAERQNPQANIDRMLAVYRQGAGRLLEQAYAEGERDIGIFTALWTTQLERPANASAVGVTRRAMSYRMFPDWITLQVVADHVRRHPEEAAAGVGGALVVTGAVATGLYLWMRSRRRAA